jgi:hypothetical protein
VTGVGNSVMNGARMQQSKDYLDDVFKNPVRKNPIGAEICDGRQIHGVSSQIVAAGLQGSGVGATKAVLWMGDDSLARLSMTAS